MVVRAKVGKPDSAAGSVCPALIAIKLCVAYSHRRNTQSSTRTPSVVSGNQIRCHVSRVSGAAMVATCPSVLRPSILALTANRRRWSSLNLRRRLPTCSRRTRFSIVCLSNASTTKAGYVQKEIKVALDLADEQPDGTIFIIPLRLEDCTVPDRLKKRKWVDLFNPKGYQKPAVALKTRAADLRLS